MPQAIDLSRVPEDQRAAFYGILFALAAADGSFDDEEKGVIHSILDLSGFSPVNRERVRGYLVRPPRTTECLAVLAKASDELRFGVMVSLVDVALADERVTPEEEQALDEARAALDVSGEQLAAIREFVSAVKAAVDRGEPDAEVDTRLEKSAAALMSVGIPVSAAYFSGSANALSAAGLESARTAIGLALGRVPGAPIAVLVGVTVQVSVGELLMSPAAAVDDLDRQRARAGRARLAIEHLLETIEDLQAEVKEKRSGGSSEEDIEQLESRCEALKQLVRTRRSALEDSA